MNFDCDVLVIGGGPAGSSTALGARREGLSVVLLESAHPPFRKVCGEFLSGPGMELFGRLTGMSTARFPRLRSVAFHRPPNVLQPGRDVRPVILRLDPPGWGIRRSTLDGFLLDACSSAGVEVHCGTRAVETRFRNGSWIVAARGSEAGGAGTRTFRTKRLVRADGRRPVTGRGRGLWVGRKGVPVPRAQRGDLDIHFMPGGYYGVSRVEDAGMSLCGVTEESAPGWNGDGDAGEPAGEVLKGTPRFALGLVRPRDPFSFSVGDARATWPPLAGDGITMALIGGSYLGERLGQPDYDAVSWDRAWRRKFGGALKSSIIVHGALQDRRLLPLIMAVAGSSSACGDWLLRRARFVPGAGGD